MSTRAAIQRKVPETISQRERARSAARAFDVLSLLAEHSDGVTSSQLASSLKIPRSTLHDLLSLLTDRHLVSRDPIRGHYLLGVEVFRLGASYLRQLSVRDLVAPTMRKLAEHAGMACQMAVLSGGDVVYVAKDNGMALQPRLVSEVGATLPAHCTALGKSMLAFMPEEDVRSIYVGLEDWSPLTQNSITSLEQLEKVLAETRKRGYSVDVEEAGEGIVCVGAPIFDADGFPVAAISLSGLSVRVRSRRMHELGRLIKDETQQLSRKLGWDRS
jgi:DNA-binding IclR family transcriptional regulator